MGVLCLACLRYVIRTPMNDDCGKTFYLSLALSEQQTVYRLMCLHSLRFCTFFEHSFRIAFEMISTGSSGIIYG